MNVACFTLIGFTTGLVVSLLSGNHVLAATVFSAITSNLICLEVSILRPLRNG